MDGWSTATRPVKYFEHAGLPFIVAVNKFDGRLEHDLDTVR